TPIESFAGSGQGGPCLTDMARGAASGRAVRGVPLRRDPNDVAAIVAAILARWRHVLSSFSLLRAAACRALHVIQRAMQVSLRSPFRSIPTGLQHRAFWPACMSVPAGNLAYPPNLFRAHHLPAWART